MWGVGERNCGRRESKRSNMYVAAVSCDSKMSSYKRLVSRDRCKIGVKTAIGHKSDTHIGSRTEPHNSTGDMTAAQYATSRVPRVDVLTLEHLLRD